MANARFVVVSDSEVPLYNAAAVYVQLMLSHRSRTGPTRTFAGTLKVDGVRPLPVSLNVAHFEEVVAHPASVFYPGDPHIFHASCPFGTCGKQLLQLNYV